MGKVMVAMSGGVDSAAAAVLLKEQGECVEGVTFELFSGGDVVAKAQRICEALGIPHRIIDLKELFDRCVVSEFVQGYAKGVTPNPCVLCNRAVKFGAFYDWAMANGADKIATGHYASIINRGDKPYIARAADLRKDQSYVLYALAADKLGGICLPLGGMTKDNARRIVNERAIEVEGGESQDICFINEGGYSDFIRGRGLSCPEGDFVGDGGRVLGRHRGILHYTIGQRKGLGLALEKSLYVRHIDAASNTVYLGDDASLFKTELTASDVHLTHPDDLELPRRVMAKIRYSHHGAPATALLLPDGRLAVSFDEPQRAITPGQSVVLYDGDVLLGGGIISLDGGDAK